MKLARTIIIMLTLLCGMSLPLYAQEEEVPPVVTDNEDAKEKDSETKDSKEDNTQTENGNAQAASTTDEHGKNAKSNSDETTDDANKELENDKTADEIPASIVDMLTKELEEESGELPTVELPPQDVVREEEVEKFKGTVKVGLWLAGFSSSFRANAGDTKVSIDDDLDAPDIVAALPIEAMFKTESQEFKLEYVHFSAKGSDEHFGIIGGVSADEDTSATLSTNSLGVEFLQRIFYYDWADLYLAAGLDIFSTNLKISGATRAASIKEIVPIVTVGLGLRVKLKEDLHLYLKSSALDYSQLLGINSTYFKPDGRYRDSELSVMWVRSDNFSFGAGWRYYDVGVWSVDINNEQRLSGPYGWLNLKF